MKTRDCVYLALDGMTFAAATQLASRTRDRVAGVKIHDLYDKHGPNIITVLKEVGARMVWVDAKLHDIPDTVRLRAKELRAHGTDIITVHASGGIDMMRKAKESGATIYAVSVLTSLTPAQCAHIYDAPPKTVVTRLAALAQEARIDGLVCSALEVADLSWFDAELIVPGTRSTGVTTHDQQRVDTPSGALRSGATKLVIGRQVTQAPDPLRALDALEHELSEAMAA